MTNTEKLSNTFQSLPAELRPLAAKLLNQVAHDVQSPLSALTMEVFSIRMLLGQLEPASSVTSVRSPKLLANLNAISSNMERASNQLAEYLKFLTTLQADSEDPSLEVNDRDHPDRR
ncbi:MAG TPA: hypothetical protein VG937_37760 [Polyangiaceae bacterium]|nr:hypothetical protein [Polyangiaceae bacterium]